MHFMCRRKVVGNLAEAEQRKDGDKIESDGRRCKPVTCVNVTAEVSVGNLRR